MINAYARLLAASPDDRVRDGNQAVEWAERLIRAIGPDNPQALDTLAAAYAAAGRFPEATSTARRAAEIADRWGMTTLATEIRGRLALYNAGRIYRAE